MSREAIAYCFISVLLLADVVTSATIRGRRQLPFRFQLVVGSLIQITSLIVCIWHSFAAGSSATMLILVRTCIPIMWLLGAILDKDMYTAPLMYVVSRRARLDVRTLINHTWLDGWPVRLFYCVMIGMALALALVLTGWEGAMILQK